MYFDKTWMGYGYIGGLQAGGIALVAGFILFGLVFWAGRKRAWQHGSMMAWSYLAALFCAGAVDVWDLIYFNFAPLESLQFIQVQLAKVHDPESIGLRVFSECVGAAVGIYFSWAIFSGDWRKRWMAMMRR